MFAELKDPVRRKIERYGLTADIEPGHFFPTVGAAVDAFRTQTGARWAAPTDADSGVRVGPSPAVAVPPPAPRPSREEPAPTNQE